MNDETRTLEQALDGERIAMVVTHDHRARPMTVLEARGSTLWFLTDRTADWVAELGPAEPVTVTVSDLGDGVFVSLTGTVRTTDDRARLEALWNPAMQVWFDGPDDEKLIALQVEVTEGEYWDGPDSGIGAVARGLAGLVTGRGDRTMGEQGDVATS